MGFGRWKSSGSRIINNTFHHVSQEEFELRFLPAFYEGPLTIEDVLIANNTIYVSGSETKAGDIVNYDPNFVKGLVMQNNLVLKDSAAEEKAAYPQKFEAEEMLV